jgi:tetratricopeptide (TPR) repeat protein
LVPLSLVVLAQLVVAAEIAPVASMASADLRTAAAASPRPAECTTNGASGETLWDHARQPALARFCGLLARGYFQLARSAEQALAAAEQADRTLPGHVAPGVLAGRALLALGRDREAFDKLQAASQRSQHALNAPEALHDFSVAALRMGRRDVAHDAYRQLVPRAGLLDSVVRRQRVYVEAAVVSMIRGSEGLPQAIAYLTEARRQNGTPGTRDFVLGALALALDRQGRVQEARGVAAEASGPYTLWALAGDGNDADGEGEPHDAERDDEPSTDATQTRVPVSLSVTGGGADVIMALAVPVLPRAEVAAMVALLADSDDPQLARDGWQRYIQTAPDSPWIEHARRHFKTLTTARRRGAIR